MTDNVVDLGTVRRNNKINGYKQYDAGQARRRAVLELVIAGVQLGDALAQVKITRNTYLKWRQRYKEFAAQIDVARVGMQALDVEYDGTHAQFAYRYFGKTFAAHQLMFINEMENTPPGNILMSLWPPEHGKTSTFEDFVCEKYATQPDYRCTIASENQTISKRILGKIKHRMEPGGPTPRYVKDFGPFKPMTGMASDDTYAQPWTSDHFNIVKKRMSDERDYSCQALGFGASIVSTRTDHLHIDDLQSTKSLARTDQMEEWFRQDALSRPGEYGITTIAGTRVGEDDIYARLADDPNLEGILKVIRYPAVRTNIVTGEQEALWPERYNLDQLERMRRKVGEEAWDRNYMQAPASNSKNRTFTDEAIEASLHPMYSLQHHVTEGAIVYVTLDPALGGMNCVMALEVTPDDKLIIRKIMERQNLRQNEQIMSDVEHVVKWCNLTGRVTDVVIETMNFQKGLANDERLSDIKNRLGFAIRPHLTGNNKYDENIGIPSMVSSFLRGEIVLPYAEDELTRNEIDELIRQLKAWRPGKRGNKLRQDRVMALWFGWILWQNRWKSRGLEMANTGAFTRQGLPYKGVQGGLVLPVGVR